MELEYIKAGDYEIPNLIPNKEPRCGGCCERAGNQTQ